MKIYGVIMAGGGGTRFWPLSRKRTPKQLLNLSGKEVMVNEAVDRLASVCGFENIFIVTNSAQVERTRQVTEGRVQKCKILAEPAARNTAACIGFAAVAILKKYGDGIMVITPSDAYIRDNKTFTEVLKRAVSAAESGKNLVTVGIAPTFPATGYGYIRCGEGDNVKKVESFVEKPAFDVAVEYLASGNYVWNSGMFVWKASLILQKFRQYLPDIYADLIKIYDAIGTAAEAETVERVYPSIRPVSIDYGIMEKSDNILVVPGEFGWSDVGSWDMLSALHTTDGEGNIAVGDALLCDCKNTTAYSSGRTVAAVGVENLVIVETADAVMVCPRDRAQDVKKIVDELSLKKREELL